MAEGCLVKGIENGEWAFYSEKNGLTGKGNFVEGIREGNWYYPKGSIDSIIEWKRFEKKNKSLIFNIPDGLEIVTDDSEYIKFSNKDTANLFNVGISVHSIDELGGDVDEYYKQGEKEVRSMGWDFRIINNAKLEPKTRTIYFREYQIIIKEDSGFRVLNAYGVMKDRKLLEISCRYNKNVEVSAKRIFFAIYKYLLSTGKVC